MTWCPICNKSFHNASSLREHARKFHPDTLDEIAPKKRKSSQAVLCHECGESLSKVANLNRHMKIFHQYSHESHDISQDTKAEKFKTENISFPNEDEFYSWKTEIEKETKSKFVNEHGSYSSENYTKKKFICHRSGTYKSAESRKRHLKVQGSNKIDGFCPAEISLKVLNNGKCEVEFVNVHIGHNQDFAHITLSKTERGTIAAKIAAKIPFQTILDEVRDECLSGDKLERMHLLTKKDLYNIAQCFNLNNEAVRHVNDAVSVDAWVREVEDICVLFYKPQDTLSATYPLLKNEDFLLIIMNQGQADMLEKYSSDVICIDGTHGLNGYEFELVTLLVLDDMREGFPSAFLISNRTDEAVMQIFFSVIKNKLGRNLQPKIFMSDMAQSFYNAWLQIMGPVEYRLFCTWHVDRAWRKNLNKINTKEKQIMVYKMLRTLLHERDANGFTQMCTNFIEFLFSNSDTKEFGVYFQEYYLKNVQSWAYCYRINCGINTNMHLERMHRTLKHIYLNGRIIKRLDKAINILMKFIPDKLFERLIVMGKGKICTKIKVLRNRHKASETLDAKRVIETDSGFGVPSSSTNEIYLVQERQPNCTCKLVCTECRICLHHYSCTCIDSCIKWNMCKHIHLVCRSLKEHHIDIIKKQDIDSVHPDPDIDTDLTAEIDERNLLVIKESFDCDSGQQKILEGLREKRETNELNCEKEKFKLELIKLVDSIESHDELRTFQRFTAPVQPTFIAMRREKTNMAFPDNLQYKTPQNKKIIQQRRLYRTTKKAVPNKRSSNKLIHADDMDADDIAINLMYPPKSIN